MYLLFTFDIRELGNRLVRGGLRIVQGTATFSLENSLQSLKRFRSRKLKFRWSLPGWMGGDRGLAKQSVHRRSRCELGRGGEDMWFCDLGAIPSVRLCQSFCIAIVSMSTDGSNKCIVLQLDTCTYHLLGITTDLPDSCRGRRQIYEPVGQRLNFWSLLTQSVTMPLTLAAAQSGPSR